MLIEKEIISPGQYWYTDEVTGLPRKLDVTPELTRYWQEQGSEMLKTGLSIPVPYEHDFNMHPMTPKEKLLNNAGEVKEYRLHDGKGGKGDKLFGLIDIQDEEARKKIGKSIRWTSPWINSFMDGNGKQWNSVISHLALTTRPRVTKQAPFGSVAAALSMASVVAIEPAIASQVKEGFCLSIAGKLTVRKSDKQLLPKYPIAFSLFSGVALGEDDLPKAKAKKSSVSDGGSGGGNTPPPSKPSGDKPLAPSNSKPGTDKPGVESDDDDSDIPSDGNPANDGNIDLEPFNDPRGDVKMEELLCDLLGALGIHCEKTVSEDMFKRSLYNAAMTKIHELTSKAQNPTPNTFGQPKPNSQTPASTSGQPNPLIQQEQQPMYMSLEDINKISDPVMKNIALSMYTENEKLRAEVAASVKTTNSLRDSKLKEATTARESRISMLSRLSPRVKADLGTMAALPAMALSMGDGGIVVDPMAQTLAVLEKGLADIPRLLTVESGALSVQPQPRDGDEMTAEREDEIADRMARMMGAPPQQKKAS